VDKFSPKGKLLQRLEEGPWLNAPWVWHWPGKFRLLQQPPADRNAGSGQIAVYDVDSGRFDGLLRDANGHAIQNDRLWALRFGNDHAAGPSNWLYFTAGIAMRRTACSASLHQRTTALRRPSATNDSSESAAGGLDKTEGFIKGHRQEEKTRTSW